MSKGHINMSDASPNEQDDSNVVTITVRPDLDTFSKWQRGRIEGNGELVCKMKRTAQMSRVFDGKSIYRVAWI